MPKVFITSRARPSPGALNNTVLKGLLNIIENAVPWNDVVTTHEALANNPTNSKGDAVNIRFFIFLYSASAVTSTTLMWCNAAYLFAISSTLSSLFTWYTRRYGLSVKVGLIATFCHSLADNKNTGSITFVISLFMSGCKIFLSSDSLTEIFSKLESTSLYFL